MYYLLYMHCMIPRNQTYATTIHVGMVGHVYGKHLIRTNAPVIVDLMETNAKMK